VGSPWYDASVLFLAFVLLVMGVMFVVYGFRLYVLSGKCSHNVQQVLFRAGICSLVVSVFFLLRCVFLLYRPITGRYMNNQLFIVMCYYVPELAPLFLSLVVHAFRVTGTEWPMYGERSQKPRKSRMPTGYQQQPITPTSGAGVGAGPGPGEDGRWLPKSMEDGRVPTFRGDEEEGHESHSEAVRVKHQPDSTSPRTSTNDARDARDDVSANAASSEHGNADHTDHESTPLTRNNDTHA